MNLNPWENAFRNHVVVAVTAPTQATEAHLGVAELTLDHPNRVLDLGTHLRFGLARKRSRQLCFRLPAYSVSEKIHLCCAAGRSCYGSAISPDQQDLFRSFPSCLKLRT